MKSLITVLMVSALIAPETFAAVSNCNIKVGSTPVQNQSLRLYKEYHGMIARALKRRGYVVIDQSSAEQAYLLSIWKDYHHGSSDVYPSSGEIFVYACLTDSSSPSNCLLAKTSSQSDGFAEPSGDGTLIRVTRRAIKALPKCN